MREHANALSRRISLSALALALGVGLAIPGIPTVTPEEAFATPAATKQAEADAALSSLMAMQSQLAQAESDYGAAMYEQDEARTRMDEAQDRIDEASDQISGLQEQLGVRAKNMYKTGATSFLDMLLGASTFQAFTTNWDLLNGMNEDDAQMVEQTKELRAEVESEKQVYAEQEQVAAAKAEEMSKILAETETLVAEQQAVYNNLSAEAAQLLAQEEAAAAAAAAAAVNAQAASQTGASTTPKYTEPAYIESTGNAIVDRAYGWVGRAEYVWGACSPGAFDCSGFVSYCISGSYSRLGTTGTFMGWPQVSDPQPGDVCVNAGHTGIYIGGGQMIHAATYGVGVVVGSVQDGMIYVRP